MSLPYRLAALWGGQAGSLLLWLLDAGMAYSRPVRGRDTQRNQPARCMPLGLGDPASPTRIFFLVLLDLRDQPLREAARRTSVLSDGATA